MQSICKTHVKDELNNKIGLSFEPKRKSPDNDELNSLYNRMCDKMKEEKLYLSPLMIYREYFTPTEATYQKR